jgi:oxygen-independent coproporphyrinogen-3 oxidase
VAAAVRQARSAGFDNLNLDLMFGLPGQTLESWRRTLEAAIGLGPDHVAAYALSLEFGTPLQASVLRGPLPMPDPDLAAEMYEMADATLEAAGLLQYEISNWARRRPQALGTGAVEDETYACRHNLQYWRNLPYLGFGAGAHGCAFGWRYANVRSPEAYIRSLRERRPVEPPMSPACVGAESVPAAVARDDTMLLGLRLVEEGVRESDFETRFGIGLGAAYGRDLEVFRSQGLLSWDDVGVRLTPRGRLLGNRVFEAFVGEGER